MRYPPDTDHVKCLGHGESREIHRHASEEQLRKWTDSGLKSDWRALLLDITYGIELHHWSIVFIYYLFMFLYVFCSPRQ